MSNSRSKVDRMSQHQAARLARIQQRSVRVLRAGDAMPDIIFNYPLEGKWSGPTATGSFINGYGDFTRTLPAVGRAVALIAETIASLPWRLIKDRDTGPAPRWINDPHMLRPDGRAGMAFRWPGAYSRIDFWSEVVVSLLLYGNAFIWSAEDTTEGPRPGAPFLRVLNPNDVDFDIATGVWIVGNERLDETLGGRIIQIRGLGPYDARGFGSGVIGRYSFDLDYAEEIRNYGYNTLHSGVPHGYLQVTSQNLTKDQAEALRSKWLEQHGDARSIAVLNSTTQFHPLSISPLDAQYIEQKKMSVQDIALMFGLDPTFLGAPSGDSATYANVESRQTIFVQTTLMPWARRIEEVLSTELPEGTWIEIDMRGLLRGDSKTRSEFYASGLEHGWITVDEVRSIERLPVMPNEPLPAAPAWPGRGEELPPGPHFEDPFVTPESFTEEKGGGRPDVSE